MFALEGCPGGIDDEREKTNKDQQRAYPPEIFSRCLAKMIHGQLVLSLFPSYVITFSALDEKWIQVLQNVFIFLHDPNLRDVFRRLDAP